MSILKNGVLLITGADGGIGSALLQEAVKREVKRVYATGISLEKLHSLAALYPAIVHPLELDVTNINSVKRAAAQCGDVDILINNAGVETKSSFLGEQVADRAMVELQVNYIGVLQLINEFLPILKNNSPSHIVNVLSVASSALIKRLGTYCASKAAAHILTQAIRDDLRASHITVVGVYPGYVDTEMSADIDIEKAAPPEIAANLFDGIERGEPNIFPDRQSSNFFEKHPISITYLT